MYKLNSDIEAAGEYIEEVRGRMSENAPRGRGRPRGSVQNLQSSSDGELVAIYKARAEQFGALSEEAAEAFRPIYERYWHQAYFWALRKIGAVYAEDLAQDTLQTVWERLNGREVVTNLKGLVRHSFEREYATMLEKLLQGRKLQRANRNEVGQEESSKLKGAVVLSLNVSAPGVEGDSAELINLVEDASANVPDSAIRLEQVRVLHDLLEQMPSNYRTPLVYQWLLGKKIKEVADELGLTMDQVKHNTSRGIVWLRKRMPGHAQDWLI
ncbi:sigma-70 family RNA polymerase sigma factor [Candidatus Chlorohelix sp.]|uniref:RNA polymerase sigma factor n=1 Tax=Candidatus Chlorohelix sp. TaxID=3139201 RepID=UPI00303665C7